MAGIFSRGVAVEAIYIGTEPVLKVYLGEVLVFDGTRSAFVSAPKASASATAKAPAVSSQPDAIVAPSAAAAVDAVDPVVSGSASVGASAAAAAVSMNPTLSSDSTIAVPAATGAGSTGTPVSDAAIAAPSAAASAQAPVPGIATTGSSNVGAPAASSAAQAPTPGVAASAPVAAVPATASAAAPVPAVADNETVSAVKAAASASAPTPGVAAIHEVPMGMDKSGASQTIGANVWTLLTTWVVRSGYPDTVISSNALRPTAGDYYFDAKVAINTARQLRARIVRNGSEVLATVDSGTSVTSVTVSTASPVTISSGDLITVEANPTAGRDVISGASNTYLTATPA